MASWIGSFVEIRSTASDDDAKRLAAPSADTRNVEARESAALERAKDIRTFDAIIAKNPDILSKLKAQ